MKVKSFAMDDLQFRRTIYADPNCTDRALIAAATDPAKKEFWDDLRSLELKIQRASKIDIPDNMASKLILHQIFESHKLRKNRTRRNLALAASVVFVFGISFTLWQQTAVVNIGDYTLAHVYEESDGFYALKVDGDVSMDSVNAQLASYGAALTEDIGRIYFARFCDFEKIRSYHMVIQGENGKVTVFVVPHSEKYQAVDSFNDEKMSGQIIEKRNASIIMVSDKEKSYEQLKSKIKRNLVFST